MRWVSRHGETWMNALVILAAEWKTIEFLNSATVVWFGGKKQTNECTKVRRGTFAQSANSHIHSIATANVEVG